MTQGQAASQKQIDYAISLGVESPDQYDMTTLKGVIAAKLGNVPQAMPAPLHFDVVKSPQSLPMPAEANASANAVSLQKTDKPHSYEFGKAGMRHKIYYNEVNELVEQMRILKANQLIFDEDINDLSQ